MKNYLMVFFILTWLLLGYQESCCQEAVNSQGRVSVATLFSQAKSYHGRTVTVQGEVIGDIFLRKTGFWVNLLDGDKAVGLWVPPELKKDINILGSYKRRGDIVRVRGIFYWQCPEHTGTPDIHVFSLEIILPGYEETMYLDSGELIPILLLAIIGASTITLFRLFRYVPSANPLPDKNNHARDSRWTR
ncbi:MAG: hypothetical protein NC911_06980 [Candidatus Omnitrophica bacterium]|nr:hypothetical protein [Candidatus Omnitrophota bacterium]